MVILNLQRFSAAVSCAVATTLCLTSTSYAADSEAGAPSVPTPPVASSKISRQGLHEFKQLVSPGFEALPLDRKLFVYHLAQAFEAGESISWSQLSWDGPAIRDLLYRIWEKRGLLTVVERAALSKYLFEISMYNGIYDKYSNGKFLLEGFTAAQFSDMLAKLKIDPPANLDYLFRVMTDPDVRKYFKAPEGQDQILASGTHFYGEGVDEKAMKGAAELVKSHPFAYPVLTMENPHYKWVRPRLLNTSGHFGPELTRIVKGLDKAKPYARPEEVKLIEAYQKAMISGEPRDWTEAQRLWLRTKVTDIDFSIPGFVETYDDPRGIIGTFQAQIVLLANSDPQDRARAEALSRHAADFEQDMPVDPRFKRRDSSNPPQAEGAYLLYWIGGGHAGGPAGNNLPNDPELRQQEGSRSYTYYNKMGDLGGKDPEFAQDALDAFYDPSYHQLLKDHGKLFPAKVQVELHEARGHGSGVNDPGIEPEKLFANFFNPLEEGRAEVASIYHILDYKKLVDRSILPPEYDYERARQFALSESVQFFTNQLVSYDRLKGGTKIRQAHQVGRQIMFNWALDGGGIEVRLSPSGIPQVHVLDMDRLKDSMGRLFARFQEIKSTGNVADLKELLESNWDLAGEKVEWAKAVSRAIVGLNRSKHLLYLNPDFQMVFDPASGEVTDVVLVYLRQSEGLDSGLNYEYKRYVARKKAAQVGACEADLGA